MVLGRPDLRPVVVSSAAGNHSSFAPSLPLVRRYTAMWARAKYFRAHANSVEFRIRIGDAAHPR